MSKQLGIGVRVWCGWTDNNNVAVSAADDPRAKTGVIICGPIHEERTKWGVRMDDGGEDIKAAESHLFPIDDDNHEESTESEIQQGETA